MRSRKIGKKPNFRKKLLIVSFSVLMVSTAFGIYLWILYSQLIHAFQLEEQFIPTRIYSDVTRINSPQPRSYIEERLKNLGYNYETLENSIRFKLHPAEYPLYLLPENHPQIGKNESSATLQFDGHGSSSVLQAMELAGQEIPDLYLEPELVTTLSRSGNEKKEIRTFLKFEEIPALVWKAIIAIEDQHFLDHKGLDPRGIARAIWINLKTHSFAQGGSTITQQLVKNLMSRRSKNIFQKMNETFLALLLEAHFDKEQILERYLNEVYLGQVGNLEIHGVAEGAQHFFGKRLEDLNLGEIAMMAGLIRGPGYYSPYRYKQRAIQRQHRVLQKMVETGQIAPAEAHAALEQPLRLAPPQTTSNKAPFFSDYVKAELIRLLKKTLTEQEITQSGFRVYTTLDSYENASAQKVISEGTTRLEHLLKLPPEDRLEGALAAVDHTTGFIRVLVGGRDYGKSTFNRILNMKRQVGSTFKPLVYLAAIQKGEDPFGVPYGPGHPAEDAPWTLIFDQGRQSWSPQNYEKKYLGWISYRTALTQSVNTVAAKVGHEIGIESIIKTAKSLGVESELPHYPSLSLGVAELSPIELLRVYGTLANRGVQEELTVIRGITLSEGTPYAEFSHNPKQVFDPAPIDLLTDILQGVMSEGPARGIQKLGFDRPSAGKTGTTSQYRDAWFAGFTPQLTSVVWVGMDQAGPQKKTTPSKLTGSQSAMPIWANFMKKALASDPPTAFPHSPFLVDVQIDRHTGKKALPGCPPLQTTFEKFIQGHEPKEASCAPQWPASSPPIIKE